MPPSPSIVLDYRGAGASAPVARAEEALELLVPGQVVLVLISDPAVEPDLREWSTRTGQAVVDDSFCHDDGVHVFLRRA